MRPLCDMHCHILPGVDDGSPDMETSLAMLGKEYQQGVRLAVLTPHFRKGMFETSRETCRCHFRDLRQEAFQIYPDMVLKLGCEFHVCLDMEKLLDSDPAYRMDGGDIVLTEFSQEGGKPEIRKQLNDLVQAGWRPIVAHVERLDASSDRGFLTGLRKMGAALQINSDAVLGLDGFGLRLKTRKLLKEGLVDYIGSDAHNMTDRAVHIGECAAYIEKKYGEAYARRLMWERPAREWQ